MFVFEDRHILFANEVEKHVLIDKARNYDIILIPVLDNRMDEAWLEWSEISQRVIEQSPSVVGSDGHALHIYLPFCRLASIVIKASKSHVDHEDYDIRIHPILFEFLTRLQTSWTPTTTWQEQHNKSDHDNFLPIQLGPLPIEPCYLSNLHTCNEKSWRLLAVTVNEFPSQPSEIFLSLIYMDRELHEYRKRVSQEYFQFTIQNSLLGRLVKQDSIMLLSCKYGFAMVEVARIHFSEETVPNDRSTEDMVYRLPSLESEKWILHLEILESIYESSCAMEENSIWESNIPGYEYLRDQILQLRSIHPSTAAPTGLLLTGVPGVGKSRLVSCIAHLHSHSHSHSHSIQHQAQSVGVVEEGLSTTPSMASSTGIFYLSVQDLIFQAVTESDLFENILLPSLRSATLWILDDLHLLEREDSGDEAVQMDVEYTAVCNAILQAIDDYHKECFIVAICQVASKLPPGLVKNGRLEKQIEMFPPTQIQRIAIWNHLLSRDVPIETTRQSWSTALANNTAGCVAADLLRIHHDSWTRCWARNPQEEKSSIFEWEDLREATRCCIPSQLSDLDVTKFPVFDSQLDWKEIHQESWRMFGGYQRLKQNIFRQVVVPWKMFLQRCDEPTASTESWMDPPPGVLFHGESGCGKTEAVRCLATSLELSLIQVRAPDILDKWLGGSEALLRSLFSRARAAAPCILFIDEIDSIACNRAEDDTNDSSSRILSTLLNEMDGVSSDVRKSKIIVVACTNRLESLDAALLRPGRLQEHFEIARPTLHDLMEILNLYLRKIPLAMDISVEELAEYLLRKNASGSEVVGLCREMCLSALRKNHLSDSLVVSHKDFVEATVSCS